MSDPSDEAKIAALLAELLGFSKADGRVCPIHYKWNELWKLLPGRQRVGNGWEPMPPLILAA